MQQQPNVSLDQTSPVVCDSCGEMYFEQALHIRKVSGILTGTGQTSYMPSQSLAVRTVDILTASFYLKRYRV